MSVTHPPRKEGAWSRNHDQRIAADRDPALPFVSAAPREACELNGLFAYSRMSLASPA